MRFRYTSESEQVDKELTETVDYSDTLDTDTFSNDNKEYYPEERY